MTKQQIAETIEAFKKACTFFGATKTWIAKIFIALNENKVSNEELDDKLKKINPTISEADKAAIARQVGDGMPTYVFEDVFSEEEKMVEGKRIKVIRFSDAVLERFKKLEKFEKDLKEIL